MLLAPESRIFKGWTASSCGLSAVMDDANEGYASRQVSGGTSERGHCGGAAGGALIYEATWGFELVSIFFFPLDGGSEFECFVVFVFLFW